MTSILWQILEISVLGGVIFMVLTIGLAVLAERFVGEFPGTVQDFIVWFVYVAAFVLVLFVPSLVLGAIFVLR
jgi:hypothetical protein